MKAKVKVQKEIERRVGEQNKKDDDEQERK